MINKIYFHTLGCAKNDVDTQVMEGILEKNKYEIVSQPDQADALLTRSALPKPSSEAKEKES